MPTLSATLVSRMSPDEGCLLYPGFPKPVTASMRNGDREHEEYCGEKAGDAKFQGSRRRVSAGCDWQRTRRTRWPALCCASPISSSASSPIPRPDRYASTAPPPAARPASAPPAARTAGGRARDRGRQPALSRRHRRSEFPRGSPHPRPPGRCCSNSSAVGTRLTTRAGMRARQAAASALQDGPHEPTVTAGGNASGPRPQGRPQLRVARQKPPGRPGAPRPAPAPGSAA
jgi:hypothetical protein